MLPNRTVNARRVLGKIMDESKPKKRCLLFFLILAGHNGLLLSLLSNMCSLHGAAQIYEYTAAVT